VQKYYLNRKNVLLFSTIFARIDLKHRFYDFEGKKQPGINYILNNDHSNMWRIPIRGVPLSKAIKMLYPKPIFAVYLQSLPIFESFHHWQFKVPGHVK